MKLDDLLRKLESPIVIRPTRRMTQGELETYLDKAADILRGSADHSEFRGYVFALLFYKRISDCFDDEVHGCFARRRGYRTVAHLLGFNKNTVQRVFQLKGWQVRKRPVGFRPRIQALPSVAKAPDERWATDLCRVWTGRDGWASLALVIDCYSRELLGWHLSRSGRSKTAEAALEQALIARYGCLGKVRHPFLLRSDNGLVFTSRSYTALVKSYGLQQEFITPYSPEQNGMVERVIRTLKDQCVHRHRFETLQHASRVIADWIGFYNHRRPHQALGMKTPAEAYALAA